MLRPDLAQVRPRGARVPEGARHARRADRRDGGGRRQRRRRRDRRGRRQRSRRQGRRREPQRLEPRRPCSASSRCAGATSGCCSRCPGQGLGNSAIASVADEEQLKRFAGRWAAMAITEPEAGLGLGRHPHHGGARRRRVRAQRREDLRDLGRARRAGRGVGDARPQHGPRRDQVVRGRALQPRAWCSTAWSTSSASARRTRPRSCSRTAACRRRPCSAAPRSSAKGGFAGAMKTFDNTRPLVAAMAVGVARACLEETHEPPHRGGRRDRPRPPGARAVRRGGALPGAGGRLRGGAPADAARPRGWPTTASPTRCRPRWPRRRRAAPAWTSRWAAWSCAAALGYGEDELLEKWARDAKILDLFEGTQQIQLLIMARQLLGKTSAELK